MPELTIYTAPAPLAAFLSKVTLVISHEDDASIYKAPPLPPLTVLLVKVESYIFTDDGQYEYIRSQIRVGSFEIYSTETGGYEKALEEFNFDEIIPISARTGEGIEKVKESVINRLPYGPQYYPDDIITDKPERAIVAEIIREAIFTL